MSRVPRTLHCFLFFFFNDTATTEIYTLSLHDALPISASIRASRRLLFHCRLPGQPQACRCPGAVRSEEHTSELQSQSNLVCRLLLEKKKKNISTIRHSLVAYTAELRYETYARITTLSS